MTILIPDTDTQVNASGGLNYYCHTKLSDSQQILLDIEEVEYEWVNGQYTGKKTGVIKKYRLEQLDYQTNHNDSGGYNAVLSSLVIRGFTKDNRLRFREQRLYWHSITKEVIAQIPDEYHNYAREHFNKITTELTTQLQDLINKGVQIGN